MDSRIENPVSFRKSSNAETDDSNLLTTSEHEDCVIVEQDGDLIIGDKMKRVYSTMLRSFKPKDEIDS